MGHNIYSRALYVASKFQGIERSVFCLVTVLTQKVAQSINVPAARKIV